MALLKYFKVEKRGPPLPNPSGSLNQQLSSSAIEEANKEVTAILCDPGKRHLMATAYQSRGFSSSRSQLNRSPITGVQLSWYT